MELLGSREERDSFSKSDKGSRTEKLTARSESSASRGAKDDLRKKIPGRHASGCEQTKHPLSEALTLLFLGEKVKGEGATGL